MDGKLFPSCLRLRSRRPPQRRIPLRLRLTTRSPPQRKILRWLRLRSPRLLSLDKYKSKNMSTAADVEPALAALAIKKISDVGDFVWVHPDEESYWTIELCFVDVPVKGEKRTILHLIDDDIAVANLPTKKIRRMRLALAAKPDGSFFFCIVPTRNLDNSFNKSALDAIEKCRTGWWMTSSRKALGYENYECKPARNPDFVPKPKWPSVPLDELAEVTFRGVNIDTDDHPGLLRLVGDTQNLQVTLRGLKRNCFRNYVVHDFEYEIEDGGLPNVLCLVAYLLDANLQLISIIRLWRGEFGDAPPFDIGPDTLVVGYCAMGRDDLLHDVGLEVSGPPL